MTYATPIEAAILYRTAPVVTAEAFSTLLGNQEGCELSALKCVRVTKNTIVLSDGQMIAAVETIPMPRLAHKFSGIGCDLAAQADTLPAFRLIHDHDQHILIRVAPAEKPEPGQAQDRYLDRMQICAQLCNLLAGTEVPLAIHWPHSQRILTAEQFRKLSDTTFGLCFDLKEQALPKDTDGNKQNAFVVTGAELLVGMPMKIGPSPLNAKDLNAPVLGFLETYVKRGHLPAHQTTFITKTGMEFTVTHTSSGQDETATLELTPAVTPAKVSVERRRTDQPAKPISETRERRRTARQDERDLRHAYRGQNPPQPRKITVSTAPVNQNWPPLKRFVGSLAFIAALGTAAALGVGMNIYGTQGLGERAQVIWDRTGFGVSE